MGRRAQIYWDLAEIIGGMVVTALPIVAAVLVVMYALSRGKAAYRGDTLVMQYGWLFKAISPLAGVIGPLMVWAAIGFHRGVLKTEEPLIPTILCGVLGTAFSLAAVPMILEAFRRRVLVDDDGLTVQGWFRTTGPLAWDEVEEVTFNESSRYYTLRGDGLALKVSLSLMGRQEFVAKCLEELPKGLRKIFKMYGAQMFVMPKLPSSD